MAIFNWVKTRIKLILIAFIVFLTVLSAYLWKENQSLKTKMPYYESSRKALGLCIESLSASNDMINNCSSAYREIGVCIKNPNTCNAEDSAIRLKQLNEEKDEINNRFLEQSKELKLLLPK